MNNSEETQINELFSLLKNLSNLKISQDNRNYYIKNIFENLRDSFILKINTLEENQKNEKQNNINFIGLLEEKIKELNQLLKTKETQLTTKFLIKNDIEKKQNNKNKKENKNNQNSNSKNKKKTNSFSNLKKIPLIVKATLNKEIDDTLKNKIILQSNKKNKSKKNNKSNKKKQLKQIKKKKENINITKNFIKNDNNLLKKRKRSKNSSLENLKIEFQKTKINNEKKLTLPEVDDKFFNILKEYKSKLNLYKKNRINNIKENEKEQKKIFYDLIKILSSYSYSNYFKNIPKEKKINLVLDLDHTLVYTNQFDEKLSKIVSKNHVYYISLRKDLKYFFDNLKLFCNLFIYTTSLIGYGDVIKNKLENDFNVKFENFYQPQTKRTQIYQKNLSLLQLNKENTLIIDDMSDIWKNDLDVVISSKKYLDLKNLGNKTMINYSYLNMKDKTEFVRIDYSIDKKDIIELHSETNDIEDKGQLYYLVQKLQMIYIICNQFEKNPSEAFLILRKSIFCQKSFNTYFCVNKDLTNMILSCGGEVINSKLANYILISKNKINEHYSELNEMKNKIILDEKYIFDCFYNITEMDENKYKIII